QIVKEQVGAFVQGETQSARELDLSARIRISRQVRLRPAGGQRQYRQSTTIPHLDSRMDKHSFTDRGAGRARFGHALYSNNPGVQRFLADVGVAGHDAVSTLAVEPVQRRAAIYLHRVHALVFERERAVSRAVHAMESFSQSDADAR